MRSNFDRATTWMLTHEGGYVNHPKDPGGATNRGVTQRVYDGYRGRKGLQIRTVGAIEDREVQKIYREQYWNAIMGDQLPTGLDYAVYDFAVNSGPSRAVKFLQELLHITADGQIGNVTLGAISGWNDKGGLIVSLCEKRWAWMKRLTTFATFGKGWTRRVMGDVPGAQAGLDTGVIDRAMEMFHGQDALIVTPTTAYAGKAEDSDLSTKAKTADAIKNPTNILKVAMGAVPGLVSAGAVAPEGPMQWAIAAAVVIVVVGITVILIRKFN